VKVAKDGQRLSTITWTAEDDKSAIPPGAFQDFGLSLKIPDKAGPLTFKALQTYSSGEVVRWIGADGSDNPAPIVTVAAPAASATPAAATPAATATPAASSDDDGGGNGLAIVALIVGAVGVLLGAAGLLSGRRARVAA